MAQSLREKCERRLEGMKNVRTDYETEARNIARFAQPSRSRFLTAEKNKGTQRRTFNNKLLDPHGIEAFRTLTNGMTSGLSSASRPWFTLALKDEGLNEGEGVREWLSEVERAMYSFLAQTNFYGAVKSGYGEMGLFGTEACVMVEHHKVGAVCHPLTFGEYWIATSDAAVPDTLYRLCPMSVRQAVMQFGNSISRRVRDMYDRSQYTELVEVYHAIEPNDEYDPTRLDSKPWRSVYWEYASEANKVISVSGYDEQPFWAPRWDVVGGDTYGVSPGMESLPALRELQMQTKRRNEAIDAMVKPEKIVPSSVRLTGEPGRVVTGNGLTKDQIIIPYQMPYQAVAAIGAEIDKCKMQIDGLSFADLFNAITNMRGVQPRNVEEIAARNEEKLTQLGPVIERVSNEKLEVAIDRVFGIMSRGGLLPPVPETLAESGGGKIDVEFVSILTQMQRMVGIGQIERTVAFVGNLAGAIPDVLDKIDGDQLVDEYAYRAGSPAKVIRSDKAVADIRAKRAQQEQMAQTAAMMPAVQQGADAARLLSETDAGGGQSLLQQMIPA
jgi:Bacteriophage head to tail connecting protein